MATPDGAVRTILGLSEERMGEVASQLLANDTFVGAVQRAISSTLAAKKNVDQGVTTMLGLVNVPTLHDVDKVRERLSDVEQTLAEIAARLEGLPAKLAARGKAKQ